MPSKIKPSDEKKKPEEVLRGVKTTLDPEKKIRDFIKNTKNTDPCRK